MNSIEWSQRLREAYESQTGDRRRIRLPVSQGISFEGPDDSVTISLSGTSVGEGNMQTDGAAFEAWAVALKEWCGVKRLSLHWQSPIESGRASAHYERFLYRVQRFLELFPDWFAVDQPERLEGARALGPGPLCLNLAGDRRSGGLSGALDGASSSGPQEHVLELALKDAVDFKAHFGPMEKVDRQWPVGLFAGPVPKRTDAIFTGGKSAIDLVGIGGTTLWVFELKAGRNAPAGILSELLFYASVMRDALPGPGGEPPRFQFDASAGGQPAGLSPADIRTCKRIEAVLIGERLHPLIGHQRIVARLNESAARDARTNHGRVPLHFSASIVKRTEVGGFEFHDLTGGRSER